MRTMLKTGLYSLLGPHGDLPEDFKYQLLFDHLRPGLFNWRHADDLLEQSEYIFPLLGSKHDGEPVKCLPIGKCFICFIPPLRPTSLCGRQQVSLLLLHV